MAIIYINSKMKIEINGKTIEMDQTEMLLLGVDFVRSLIMKQMESKTTIREVREISTQTDDDFIYVTKNESVSIATQCENGDVKETIVKRDYNSKIEKSKKKEPESDSEDEPPKKKNKKYESDSEDEPPKKQKKTKTILDESDSEYETDSDSDSDSDSDIDVKHIEKVFTVTKKGAKVPFTTEVLKNPFAKSK